MANFIFWLIWCSVGSVGIKYTSMQLLNVNLNLIQAFLILLTYQWIRFIKPEKQNEVKQKKQDSLSDFNTIIYKNFKKNK